MSFLDKPTLSADNGSFFSEKPCLSYRKTYLHAIDVNPSTGVATTHLLAFYHP